MLQLRQAHSLVADRGIRVLVVTFETGAEARAYDHATGLAWPLVLDPERSLYEAYGMGRAKRRHLWGLSTWRAYGRELLLGRLPRWPVADTFQQGGDVLIDPEGIVRFVYVGAGPGHRPSVEEILRRGPVS